MNESYRWHFLWNRYRSALEFKRNDYYIHVQVWRIRAWKLVGNGEQ